MCLTTRSSASSDTRVARRGLLAGGFVGGLAAGAILVGCAPERPVTPSRPPAGTRRIRYGDDPSQFGELTMPDGKPRGVVVIVHGGFWKAEYDLSLGRPLAADLVGRGWAAWNVEYRRVGSGGGAPATLDDVAAAVDALADVPALDLATVVTLGHSAGGHLATWSASRGRFDRWTPARVPVTAVVSQAGVLDLGAAYADGLGGGAVERFLGHPPGPDDAPVDPLQQVPLDVPVWCVHGEADGVVPIGQSEAYVDAATAAGGRAELVPVEGDHFVVIDTGADAWARTVEILDGLG